MKIDHLKFQSLDCQKTMSKARVLPHPCSLDFLRLQLRICSLLLPSPRAVQLPSHYKSTSDSDGHHYGVYSTLVSIGINHPFARCLRLPMKAFNMRKFEWKICSLTLCVFVHSLNKHWRSHLTKEIVSNFRRSHSPAHSKKSPPYSIMEGASAVSSWANLLRKCESFR